MPECGLLLNLNVVAPGGGGSDLPIQHEARSIPCPLPAGHAGPHDWENRAADPD